MPPYLCSQVRLHGNLFYPGTQTGFFLSYPSSYTLYIDLTTSPDECIPSFGGVRHG
jgi:hypothetical protein